MALVYRTARGEATDMPGYIELMALQLNEHAPEDPECSSEESVWQLYGRM